MHDADARRHDPESVEGLHPPLQKLIALPVALELDIHVELQRVRTIGEIDLHGVVDHQIDGDQRLDDARIFLEARRRRAHRRQIDQQWHAGEVLQQDPRDHEGDLFRPLGLRSPSGQRADIILCDFFSVDVPQHGLQDGADADRQPRDGAHARRFQFRKRVELSSLSVAEIERVERAEGIAHRAGDFITRAKRRAAAWPPHSRLRNQGDDAGGCARRTQRIELASQ